MAGRTVAEAATLADAEELAADIAVVEAALCPATAVPIVDGCGGAALTGVVVSRDTTTAAMPTPAIGNRHH